MTVQFFFFSSSCLRCSVAAAAISLQRHRAETPQQRMQTPTSKQSHLSSFSCSRLASSSSESTCVCLAMRAAFCHQQSGKNQ